MVSGKRSPPLPLECDVFSIRYGGNLLGPIRFTHIETCAHEVCRSFKMTEEVEEHITNLETLDKELKAAREELAALNPVKDDDGVGADPVAINRTIGHVYTTLLDPPDPTRAKRLVNARTSALRNVQALLARRKESVNNNS